MRTVRTLVSVGPFIRGQKLQVFRKDEYGLFLKGPGLNRIDPKEEVVFGPFLEGEVEEYVPDPPAPTVAEKLKGLMP